MAFTKIMATTKVGTFFSSRGFFVVGKMNMGGNGGEKNMLENTFILHLITLEFEDIRNTAVCLLFL